MGYPTSSIHFEECFLAFPQVSHVLRTRLNLRPPLVSSLSRAPYLLYNRPVLAEEFLGPCRRLEADLARGF